jgi:hypothetical protein
MTKVECAVEWAINVAEDNSHGYSQASRWGTPDYDCSSFIITAWQQAGVPVKVNGATYTGNMRAAFLIAGFKDVTASVDMSTGSGLHRGDVLLNYVNHTAMSIGSGKVVHARGSDGHPEAGDQTGNEIRIQSYWNYPWDCVLRFPETIEEPDTGLLVDGECGEETWLAIAKRMPIVKKGSRGWAVTALQAALNFLGAELDADGDCGRLTEKEIKEFQEGRL